MYLIQLPMMQPLLSRGKKLSLLLIFAVCGIQLQAGPEGYQVRFRIQGLQDTICLVANYYGTGTYITDTLIVDRQGRCTFRSKPDQPRGVYILVLSENNYFDFVLNNDRKFSMETTLHDPVANMRISGSPDNQEFYDYMNITRDGFIRIQEFQEQAKACEGLPDSAAATCKTLINQKIDSVNQSIITYRLKIVEERPLSFLAMLINAMKEPVIPEVPILENGRKDSTFAYRYYRAHYWDDMNLSDPRLIRTPVFHKKLVKYVDQVIPQHPDSIFPEAVRLIELARPDPEMFKYLVWFMTYHFENSDIMGFDEVFVRIVDRYYVTGEATWVNGTALENIIKKANRIRPLLIGEKAPNLVMMDTNETLVSLYNIDAFVTILFFWDPDCGHCEKETLVITMSYMMCIPPPFCISLTGIRESLPSGWQPISWKSSWKTIYERKQEAC